MSGSRETESGDRERAARLRAMGRVLRDAGSDETGDGWGEPPTPGPDSRDAALRREVPPHHGG